ncbi:MAG: hypothetical protein FJX63_09280, partial [Alphaproteobacteria bacterium]|nr:hypothetical protein [Alphaproteobacteria bacterium]
MNPRFLEGAAWGFPGEPVEHIETHAAHVFLVSAWAFKVKKEIVLPYLDFSTSERRRAMLADELAINRRFAPQIYEKVIEVEGEPALVMHRFDNRLLLSALVGGGRVGDGLARGLAEAAARSHDSAERSDASGSAILKGLGAQLGEAFLASPEIFPAAAARAFAASHGATLERLTPTLDLRSAAGLVPRCHGDMHCGNIVLLGGVPTLFDAIEFSEKIATIDVLYDLAYLLMDLVHHGEARAANIVLGHYLGLRRSAEDLSGLALLPLFLATRVGVRALVAADRAHELVPEEAQPRRAEALSYFRAAERFLAPPRPMLICIGGLSGTGKSTLAASLAPLLGTPPGALHIRSDVERKILAGVA